MSKPFHAFKDENSDGPSWDAASEQFALISVVGSGDVARIQGLLSLAGQPAELLESWDAAAGQTDDEKTIPSHALIRQGGQYWLAIYGTENSLMWSRNLVGAFLRQDWAGDPQCRVHGYFAWAAEQIIDKVLFLYEDRLDGTLNVSGHSLGAGVANLLGLWFKSRYPASTVNVMGFGEPKALATDYNGTPTDTKFRIVNDLDPVPLLPFAGTTVSNAPLAFDVPTVQVIGSWKHTGTFRKMAPDGSVNSTVAPNGRQAVQASLFERTVKPHWPRQYLLSLAAVHKAQGTDPNSAAMIQYAYARSVDPTAANNLNLPDPSAFVDDGQLNQVYSKNTPFAWTGQDYRSLVASQVQATTATVGPDGSLSGGFSGNSGDAAVATLISGTTLWRVVAQLNNALYGSSHSIVMRGPTTLGAALDLAEKWVTARACLLGSGNTYAAVKAGNIDPTMATPVYQYMTVYDALAPRKSNPKILGYEVGGPYSTDGGNTPADVFSSAFSLRMSGVSDAPNPAVTYHTETFVGFPDVCLFKGRVDKTRLMKAGKDFGMAMKEYVDLITSQTTQFGFLGEDPAEPQKLITAFALDVDNQVKCTVAGHGYVSGDWVRITGKVGKNLRKVYRVSVIDANTFTLLRSSLKSDPLPKEGRVQKTRNADGTRKQVFFRFLVPTALDTDRSWLLKVTKRNLRPKSIPVSFFQKGHRSK